MKSGTALFILVILFLTCKQKTDNSKRELGRSYYNTKLGSWIMYKVDSIVFSDFNIQVQKIDTYQYQLKEIITDRFVDDAGNETNKIEIYKRATDSAQWEINKVWSSNLSDLSFEKTEENIRYVKMAFPIEPNKTWNGNQFNTALPWDYTFVDINKVQNINGLVFNETVTVLQKDSSTNTFIEKAYAKEIFARNIGMVYKQSDTLEVQNNIKKGLYYRQTIIDWSK